jgi:F-type H+-transporting ATPase subunit c
MQFLHLFSVIHPLIAAIGAVFNASIQAKTRQPELRADVERDQWLGFALTEACFFYGLVGGFIAFFL